VTLLLDTGPLVAAIDRSDKHHACCAALLESAEGPLLVPATVIVEVCWLLEERPDIEAAFLTSVATGEFEHATITATDLAHMAELVRAYADLPLGAVDASVIAVAERLKLTDRRGHLGPAALHCRPPQAHNRPESPALTRSAKEPRSEKYRAPQPATGTLPHARAAVRSVFTSVVGARQGHADRGHLNVVLRGSAQFDPPPASFSHRNPMRQVSAAHSCAAESPG